MVSLEGMQLGIPVYGGTVNQAPVIEDQGFSISDAASIEAAVGTVVASDADSLTFAITEGNEAGKFAIDPDTAEITTLERLDYYESSSYSLTVTADDGVNDPVSATVTITVTNGDTILLLDNFTTADTAPLGSPRTCEPTGTLVVVETDGQMSISSNKLNIPAQASPTWGDLGFRDNVSRTRANGVAMRMLPLNLGNTGGILWGWGNGSGVSYANLIGLSFYRSGTTANLIDNAANTVDISETMNATTDYNTAQVMRLSGGCDHFIDGKHVFRSRLSNADGYAMLGNFNCANNTLDKMDERQLAGYWLDDNIHSLRQSPPVSATVYDTANALDNAPGSAFIYLSYTLPGTTAGRVLELKFNYQDANNYWVARVERNAGNTQWDFEVDSVSAGVATNRVTVTNIGTNGEIAIKTNGSLRNFYVNAQGAIPVKRGAQVNVSHLDTETEVSVVTTGTGWTLSLLEVIPRDSDLYGRITA